jgi:hypothetical protein
MCDTFIKKVTYLFGEFYTTIHHYSPTDFHQVGDTTRWMVDAVYCSLLASYQLDKKKVCSSYEVLDGWIKEENKDDKFLNLCWYMINTFGLAIQLYHHGTQYNIGAEITAARRLFYPLYMMGGKIIKTF